MIDREALEPGRPEAIALPVDRLRPFFLRVLAVLAGFVALFGLELLGAVNRWLGLLSLPVIVGFLIVVLPRISYRRRDFLMMLIPVYSLYFFGVVFWRLALLPYRDWAPRSDEAGQWMQVRHPVEPGGLLYVLRPGTSGQRSRRENW